MSAKENGFAGATIQRAPHDAKNPYTMIRNDLLRDRSISPDCIWLICYLLTKENEWPLSKDKLIDFMKGRWDEDKTLKVLKESINSNYFQKKMIEGEGNEL